MLLMRAQMLHRAGIREQMREEDYLKALGFVERPHSWLDLGVPTRLATQVLGQMPRRHPTLTEYHARCDKRPSGAASGDLRSLPLISPGRTGQALTLLNRELRDQFPDVVVIIAGCPAEADRVRETQIQATRRVGADEPGAASDRKTPTRNIARPSCLIPEIPPSDSMFVERTDPSGPLVPPPLPQQPTATEGRIDRHQTSATQHGRRAADWPSRPSQRNIP